MTTPMSSTIRSGQFPYRLVGPPVLALDEQNLLRALRPLDQRAESEYY